MAIWLSHYQNRCWGRTGAVFPAMGLVPSNKLLLQNQPGEDQVKRQVEQINRQLYRQQRFFAGIFFPLGAGNETTEILVKVQASLKLFNTSFWVFFPISPWFLA
ncbi:MAG: hypothetical protein ACO1NZ_12685 [Adhaeribacter sp.]